MLTVLDLNKGTRKFPNHDGIKGHTVVPLIYQVYHKAFAMKGSRYITAWICKDLLLFCTYDAS